MVIIHQYPHWLNVPAADAEGVPRKYKCRAESNDNNGFIYGEGGIRIDYMWTVHFPLYNSPILPEGTEVEIRDGATVIAKDLVKRYFKTQLHIRAWL